VAIDELQGVRKTKTLDRRIRIDDNRQSGKRKKMSLSPFDKPVLSQNEGFSV